MKKYLLVAVMVIAVCLTLAACKCEHQYVEVITLEATCTEPGLKTFTCSQCDDSYTEEIPVSEHTFGKRYVSKAATCTSDGVYSVKCTQCEYTEETEVIPKTAHSYKNVTTKEATCNSEGQITPTCDCGATATPYAIAKLEHRYTSQIVKEATYKQKGNKEYTCSLCGDQYTESIPKLDPNELADAFGKGTEYIKEAIELMNSALKYYKYGYDSDGKNATASMLIKTGLSINYYKDMRDLCGDHPELQEIKSLLDKMIEKLEYVKKYDSVSKSNYIEILLDIYHEDVYQDAIEYQQKILDILETFA